MEEFASKIILPNHNGEKTLVVLGALELSIEWISNVGYVVEMFFYGQSIHRIEVSMEDVMSMLEKALCDAK